MNKKLAIIISLVLAIVFSLGIVWTANKKNAELSETVSVAQTTGYVPMGNTITAADIKMVEVQKNLANNMVTEKEQVIGNTALVSLIEGQYIYKNNLNTEGISKKAGFVEVYIPTDAASSAMVTAGQRVNIHMVDRNNRAAQTAPVIYKGARVLHSLDQQGNEIVPGSQASISDVKSPKGHVPVTVGLEVPDELSDTIIQFAHNDAIYLAKTDNDSESGSPSQPSIQEN